MFQEYIVYVSGVSPVRFWSISCTFLEYIVYEKRYLKSGHTVQLLLQRCTQQDFLRASHSP